MTSWFIDGIDVRGGLAVATQRQSSLLDKAFIESGPSAFIAPPAFVPEFLENPGTGLALARNRGQSGLFFDGQEVPFKSLAGVAEFVRRSYVRGAGGDGPGENGGSFPPPRPEGGEPPEGLGGIEFGGEGAEGLDPAVAFLSVARANKALSASLKTIGESHDGATLAHPTESASPVRRMRLARGAVRVLRELMRSRIATEQERLHRDVVLRRFISVVTRMALWRAMFGPGSAALEWVFGRSYRPQGQFDDFFYHRLLEYVKEGVPYYYWPEYSGWTAGDMFDDVAAFPVPAGTVAEKDGKNLQALLSKAAATPDTLLDAPGSKREEECAELVLFAAACLCLGSQSSPSYWAFDEENAATFGDHMAWQAQIWLQRNVPRIVYAPAVENLIGGASAVPA